MQFKQPRLVNHSKNNNLTELPLPGIAIIRQLANGRQGPIFLVKNERRDRYSIIKSVRIDRLATQDGACEAKVQKICNHSNVVSVLDERVIGNMLFMEMEYMDSGSLQEILSSRFIPIVEALTYLRQALHGLDNVHRQEIVHRDFGVENIMISEGSAKLSDFGSAMHARSGRAVSDFVYAPYAPPDCLTQRCFSPQSDLFAAGVTLLRLVNNAARFHTTLTEARGNLRNKGILDVESLTDLLPVGDYVPQRLRPIITKAVSFNNHNRYNTADDFIRALAALQAGRPWSRINQYHWVCRFRDRAEALVLKPGAFPSVHHTIGGRQKSKKIFRSMMAARGYLHDLVADTALA